MLVGVLVIAAVGYLIVSRGSAYTTVAVTRGTITQEVLATGHVQSPTVADLAFKGNGKLASLSVKIGQHVAAGDVLAWQDGGVLAAQLAQARANAQAASAALAKLESGATPQAIAVSKAQLSSAELALTNAYGTVASTLADAQTKAQDAVVNQLANFFSDAQTSNPKLTFIVSDYTLVNRIQAERADATNELAAWQKEFPIGTTPDARDAALSSADTRLGVLLALGNDAVSAVALNSGLSSTDAAAYRASAATGLAELNAARAAVEALMHTIASDTSAVATAQANLNLTTASSTQNDIDAQQAAVAAAQANVGAIAAQLRDLEIVAPFAGTVTDTNGAVGEIVGPATPVVSLMPDAHLEVKANVSEDNVVHVTPGNPVRIELDAFPSSTHFAGVVSSVDPTETLVGGAVYYQTTILFDAANPAIRSGMTANVWITTASSTDALIVPASALASLDATTTVRVLQNGVPVTRTVTIGIQGVDGMVQVLSGLSNGELVVTGS